jgi:hypothetical protein
MVGENVTAEEDRDRLLAVVGSNPYVADFLAAIGTKFVEGKDRTGEGGAQGAMTPPEAKGKMEELIRERAAESDMSWKNPAKFERLSNEIKRLAAMAAGEKP